jgi:hypothetical protein
MSNRINIEEQALTVFVDTSVFVANVFDFDGPLFKAVVARVEAGEIRFVATEVTQREIRARIAESVREAEQGLAKFRNAARVLRPLTGNLLAAAFGDVDLQAVREQIEERFSRFLQAARAQVISFAAADAPDVFDAYFNHQPPFGPGKKKSEFPDAFALQALLRHASETDQRITVVSADEDWKAACERHDRLEYAESLEHVLEHRLAARPITPEAVRNLLDHHRADLEAQVLESFRDRGFYWDSDEGLDAEVVETSDEEIVSWERAVIDQDEHSAEIAGDAEISLAAQVTYPDPEMCPWDSEEQKVIVLGYESATLAATVRVPVTFRVDIDELRNGNLEIGGLTVNRHEDVWIRNYEVEERRSDDE